MINTLIVISLLAFSSFSLGMLLFTSPLHLVAAKIQSQPDLPGTTINESSSDNERMSNNSQLNDSSINSTVD
jgi:hypothetical protein